MSSPWKIKNYKIEDKEFEGGFERRVEVVAVEMGEVY